MPALRAVTTQDGNKIALNLLEPTHVFDQMVSSLTVATSDAISGPPEVGGVSYSKASYYTILGLYLLSFPGLWSTIKRSTSAKVKRKTFVTKGEKATAGEGKSLREEAGGIMACKEYPCRIFVYRCRRRHIRSLILFLKWSMQT